MSASGCAGGRGVSVVDFLDLVISLFYKMFHYSLLLFPQLPQKYSSQEEFSNIHLG